MMDNSKIPHLGYVLHPGRRHSEPGYSRLDVWLSDQASGLHFDPYYLRIPVADETQSLNWATISHPYYSAEKLRICAGPVDVMGLGDKRLEVFTFGGELAIQAGDTFTLTVFSSEAPILVRTSAHAAAILLMEEGELLLALRRGVWDEHPGEFDRRLLAAQPVELYHAILCTIRERMKSMPHIQSESDQHLLYQLRLEIEDIEKNSTSELRALEVIL